MATSEHRQAVPVQCRAGQQVKQGCIVVVAGLRARDEHDVVVPEVSDARQIRRQFEKVVDVSVGVVVEESAPKLGGLPQRVPPGDREDPCPMDIGVGAGARRHGNPDVLRAIRDIRPDDRLKERHPRRHVPHTRVTVRVGAILIWVQEYILTRIVVVAVIGRGVVRHGGHTYLTTLARRSVPQPQKFFLRLWRSGFSAKVPDLVLTTLN